MRHMLTRVLAFALLVLITGVRPGLAQELHPEELQDEPWVKEVPCSGNDAKQGYVGSRQFQLCFDVPKQKLQRMPDGPTEVRTELSITSYTKKGQPNLTALKIERVLPEAYPGLIINAVATPEGPEQPNRLSSRRVFKVAIQLTDQSRTGEYPIELEMSSGKETAEQKVAYSLPILVQNSSSVLIKPKPQSLVDCWAGSRCSSLELQIQNKLPYKIKISNISISSGDLLEATPTGEYSGEIDVNSPPRDLRLFMQANPITLAKVLTGFGSPQLTMRIDYKDQYDRPLWTETPAAFEIRPNLAVILIFLILGAALGTLVKAFVEKLERSKLISREAGIFIITTFMSGIVVCVVALFTNMKLTVWNANSYSAWDPKVVFITAVVATINGLPLLYQRLKVSQSAAVSKSATPQSGSGVPNN